MAVKYVKNFEFPASAGFKDGGSCNYAKGGAAKKGSGVMVLIGLGKPAKGPMKKSEGGDVDRDEMARMAGDANAVTEAERIMSQMGQKPQMKKKMPPKKGSPYIPGSNIPADKIYSKEDMERMERGYAKGGKAEKKISKVMREYKAGELHSGSKKGPKVTNPKQAIAIALSEAGKSKKGYAEGGAKKPAPLTQEEKEDAIRKDQARGVKVMLGKAKGGMAKHPDEAMDKALIKKMVKPSVLKKAMGGPAAAPQSPLQRMGMQAAAPAMGRAKGVPVAPRAPMIAPPSMGQRGVGVNAKRPGGPDVGKIRAMMAKAATAARPEASPAVMKKGGKVK